MKVDYDQVKEDYAKKDAEIFHLKQELKTMSEFADLWYFVIDDASREFEEIVNTCDPKIWLNEVIKLKKSRK